MDSIDPGIAAAKFDQTRSEAMRCLRESRSFLLVSMNYSEDGFKCEQIVAVNIPDDERAEVLFSAFMDGLIAEAWELTQEYNSRFT